MSLLNVGTRALMANQAALQTTGHNISNVNTQGYSRQSVSMQTVQGQFTGGGYIGNGVNVETVLRNHDELLTRQAATANSVQAADAVRADRLAQLQDVFAGGSEGLGASINDMMNAFSDVANAPSDLSARSILLSRADETAGRMRSAATRIGEIQDTVSAQVDIGIGQVNDLAKRIAALNEQIARAKSTGQSPNDLLDQRDSLVNELNKYIQTSQTDSADGTINLFVGTSHPIVLGTTTGTLVAETINGNERQVQYLASGSKRPVELTQSMIGGGELGGLIRFQNNDLAEGRNLLGRMAQTIGMTMNAQHKLGLTLDGQQGKDMFAVANSISGNPGGTVTFTDPAQLAASDYEVQLSGTGAGQVVRLSDGKSTSFTDLANLAGQTIDGLTFDLTTAGSLGNRVLFQPYKDAAANMQALVHSPRELAAASPVNASMSTSNTGNLRLTNLQVTSSSFVAPTPGTGVTLTFDAAANTYTVTGSPNPASNTTAAYVPNQPIVIDGWEITLSGAPRTGDSVTVGNALDANYYQRNAGNATSLMGLRDAKVFDGTAMSDGFAGAMAQIGTRTQSAQYASQLSKTIASNIDRDRTAVSGVNLDEEAARLIQFQQAYQASAKMIQIAQNVFDTLIQGMR